MALLSDQFQQAQALKMLKKFWPRSVFYQMQGRQNACSFTIMLMLGSKTQDSKATEPAENFKYLGSWISDSEQDFKARKASAWIACNKINKSVEIKAATRNKDETV